MLRLVAAMLCWSVASLALAQGSADDATREQRRNEIRAMAYESLVILYQFEPGASQVVERAAGYAVFGMFDTKLFSGRGPTGKGVVVDHATKRPTFMNMLPASAGSGPGGNKSRLIFVFETQEALRDFASKGWDAGAQAGATALMAERGGLRRGAVAVSPVVSLYQLTGTEVAASVTLGGTKFSADPDLN